MRLLSKHDNKWSRLRAASLIGFQFGYFWSGIRSRKRIMMSTSSRVSNLSWFRSPLFQWYPEPRVCFPSTARFITVRSTAMSLPSFEKSAAFQFGRYCISESSHLCSRTASAMLNLLCFFYYSTDEARFQVRHILSMDTRQEKKLRIVQNSQKYSISIDKALSLCHNTHIELFCHSFS